MPEFAWRAAQPDGQLVEGRTRVGVLRGRHADGLHVADTHLAWVGRRRLMACE